MARSARQSKILELITKNEIETQEELVDELKKSGYNITQATISRDIKELRLIKVLSENKKYKYAREVSPDHNVSNKTLTIFRESVISIAAGLNNIIIKTLPGSARAASVLIDKLNMPEILGCVAGDDAVIIVTNNEAGAVTVVERFKNIIGL